MPVFLFSYHAYRSWMPDHERGYTQRRGDILPTNDVMAALFRGSCQVG